MEKSQEVMRNIFEVAFYIAAVAFLTWRAETYVDLSGHQLLVPRLMCFMLALMIAGIGVIRAMDAFNRNTSEETS